MNPELNIEYIYVKAKQDGSDDRCEFIHSDDLDLYHETLGRQSSYDGNSDQFIQVAKCNSCPVNDVDCKPTIYDRTPGRIVFFNSAQYPDGFPCHAEYYRS